MGNKTAPFGLPFAALNTRMGKSRDKAQEPAPQCPAHLDGGTSKPCQLLDVLPLLPNDGSHCLRRDEQVHNLLLWQLARAWKSNMVREPTGSGGVCPSTSIPGLVAAPRHICAHAPKVSKQTSDEVRCQGTYRVLMGEGAGWRCSVPTREVC